MSAPASQPTWDQHPLWLDSGRREDIADLMWIRIQKAMFPKVQPRSRRNPRANDMALLGGISAEDVFNEAISALMRYNPSGDVNWEGAGIRIAEHKAVDAVRKAQRYRRLEGDTEGQVGSLDSDRERGESDVDPPALDVPDDEAVEEVLRAQRTLAIRQVAYEILNERDRDIVFRITRGDDRVAIASDVGVSRQRVGQIYTESLKKINVQLRRDPQFQRLYEPEGEYLDG